MGINRGRLGEVEGFAGVVHWRVGVEVLWHMVLFVVWCWRARSRICRHWQVVWLRVRCRIGIDADESRRGLKIGYDWI